MSRRKIKAGSTSVMAPIFVQDTSSTTGGGLGSLVFNTSGLAAKYRRAGDNTWTAITLATATVGTFTSGGFIADGGPVTGGYEVGVPDAALAAGARWAQVVYYGATNMLPVLLEFELDAVDYQDATRFGLSSLPNASAGANGGLPTLDSDLTVGSKLQGILTTLLTESTTGWLAAAFKKFFNVGSSALTTASANQSGDNYARIGVNGVGLTNLGDARLAHLDADVSSRLATSGYTTPPTAAQITTAIFTDLTSSSDFTTLNSIGKLLVTNLDAAVSSRSTYSGGDTAGTTTLLSRLTQAILFDGSGYVKGNAETVSDKTGFALTAAYDAAKTAAQAGDAMTLTSGERSTLAGVIMSDVTDTVGADVVSILIGVNTLTGANAVETGLSLLQAERIILAGICGVLTTAGQNPEVYKNPAGTATRISVANDAAGNRTAVTLTP